MDIYEKYPVPFGLVRYGVAPDHQSIKVSKIEVNGYAKTNESNYFNSNRMSLTLLPTLHLPEELASTEISALAQT